MNRKLLYTVTLFCLICEAAWSQVPYRISGAWREGAGKSLLLKLMQPDDTTGTPIDSATVAPDGSFAFSGSVEKNGYGMLSEARGDVHGFRMIFFDGKPVELVLADTVTTVGRSKRQAVDFRLVKGDREQEGIQEAFRFFSDHFVRSFAQAFAEAALEKTSDIRQADSLKAVVAAYRATDRKELDAFFERYSDCLVAPYFMELNMLKEYSGAQLQGYYGRFSDRVKASPKGKEMGDLIASINRLAPGSAAPEFTLATPEGKNVSLKDFRGRLVLIDFWASWCAPCLGEMPNLKKIYAEFHPKGLEVIGVSMDNSKTAWTKAIAREALPWIHVSSLKGMKRCPVGNDYQVLAIPKLYIIDREGKIVAKDLRGNDLAKKIAEIIGTDK